jgi:hypothetical protein
MERNLVNVRHSLRPEPSITFEEEAVEVIGVILAGIIIGLLGKFVAPGNQDNIPIALTDPMTLRAL